MKHAILIRWLVGLTALIVACNPALPPNTTLMFGPSSGIDAPLDGTPLPPNPAVEVTSHSADPLRIVQVELSVNGQVVQTSPNADTAQTLVLTKHPWSPPGPGNYTLMVRAQNSAGGGGGRTQRVWPRWGAQQPPPPPRRHYRLSFHRLRR